LPNITITTENLSKRFNREWIFRNLSCDFKGGEIYAITGPNGSGKSTLLQTLAGMIPQSGGSIKYTTEDQRVVDIESIYQHLTFTAPYLDLIEEFTLREHLDFHFNSKPSRLGRSTDEIIKLMYLEKASDKRIGDYSSGMKQRVKLGLALFTESSIVFLDEPGSNLDRNAFNWYYETLLKMPAGTSIFIASNNREEYPESAKVLNISSFK
jgi:ABC-type multidrug transport system ATPase subunit